MKAIILAVLLVGSVGWGQQHVVLYSPENATEHGTPKYPQPAPLKCGGGEFPGNEFGPYAELERVDACATEPKNKQGNAIRRKANSATREDTQERK